MLQKITLFILLYWVSLPSYATEGTLPPPFTAYYKVYLAGIPVGKGTRTLRQLPNGDYVFETSSRASGMAALLRDDKIIERSVFSYQNDQIIPLSYTYNHSGSKKQRFVETTFDWANQQVWGIHKEQRWELPLPAGVLDKHVYQIAFMRDLQQGGIQELTYQVADKGQIKAYTPKLLGNAELKTGMGKLNAVKYQRISPSNRHRRTTIWLVADLYYLPAQVEHVEKEGGEVISMVLQRVEGLGQ